MGRLAVAIVHDWLVSVGGGERVVSSFHRMFPDAPIFTSVVDRSAIEDALKDADIRPTLIQSIPGATGHFRELLPLYPFAFRSLDLSGYDLVLSSSSAFAKDVRVGGKTLHVCYCHNPMRFAWDYDAYVAKTAYARLVKQGLRQCMGLFRRWDTFTAQSISHIIANSFNVQRRIKDRWSRDSVVIHPPVNVKRFSPGAPGEYFLVLSRLMAYKRIDLAVRACTERNYPLVVIGDGPASAELRAMAGPTVRFLGALPDGEVTTWLANCRALIFPGEEDFGITPLEAMASGKPVVAFGKGGALETVVDGVTGVFFPEQTWEATAAALDRLMARSWDVPSLIRRAEAFSEDRFEQRIADFIESVLNKPIPASEGNPCQSQ